MTGPARLLSQPQRQPLFGRDATRRIEQAAQALHPPFTLMARAGASVARLACALAPHAKQVWIACGPGNNGGDGLEAAVRLHALGLNVSVTLAADPNGLPADASTAYQRALAAGLVISATPPADPLTPHDLAIDAVLGVGSSRAPEVPLAQLISRLNEAPCPVLAVDLPSGLDADSGQPFGPACVNATHTLSLLTLKPGLFTGAGRDHAGDIWFDPLGVPCGAEAPTAWRPSPPPPQRRSHAQHKGSFGDVLVVGGSPGMTGAALLAARAAHAAGAGRVHLDLLDPSAAAHDPARPELMFRPATRRRDLPLHATVVAGCGGGSAIAAALPRLLSDAERLVLDADALNTIAADTALQTLLKARTTRDHTTVLTPHPLEAARLLAVDTSTVQHDRLAAARRLADQFGAVIVLKGSGTVITAPGAVPHINPTGNAALATAGTGDVLAGWIGGLWAVEGGQPLPPALHGTWQHGEAADRCPTATLRAADLIEALHALMRR